MLQACGKFDLTFKPFRAERLRDLRVQHLERDRSIMAQVVSEIHDREPAAAELSVNAKSILQRPGEAVAIRQRYSRNWDRLRYRNGARTSRRGIDAAAVVEPRTPQSVDGVSRRRHMFLLLGTRRPGRPANQRYLIARPIARRSNSSTGATSRTGRINCWVGALHMSVQTARAMRWKAGRVVAVLASLLASHLALAQGEGPRVYLPVPVGTQRIVPTYMDISSSFNLQQVIFLRGADVRSDVGVLTYARFFAIAGHGNFARGRLVYVF